MKTAAKPAVSSSDAGTSAEQLAVAALVIARQLPGLELRDEVLRVVVERSLCAVSVRVGAGVSSSTGTPDS